MSVLWPLLLFSASMAGALLSFGTASAGVRRGRVYYEPSCPPVEFARHPVRFVLLVVLEAALGTALSWGALNAGLWLWRTI